MERDRRNGQMSPGRCLTSHQGADRYGDQRIEAAIKAMTIRRSNGRISLVGDRPVYVGEPHGHASESGDL